MISEFKEQQQYTQWWLWIILFGIALLPIIGIYKQLILGEPFGSKPLPDVGFNYLRNFNGIIYSDVRFNASEDFNNKRANQNPFSTFYKKTDCLV